MHRSGEEEDRSAASPFLMMPAESPNRPTSQRRFARGRSHSGIGQIVPEHPERTNSVHRRGDCHGRRGLDVATSTRSDRLDLGKQASRTLTEKTKDDPVVRIAGGDGALEHGHAHVMGGAAEHLAHSRDHRLVRHVTEPQVSPTDDMSADQTPITSPAQMVSIGNTLTNFTNEPLSPVLNLFNPSLGTLLSVTVSQSATVQSTVTSTQSQPVVGYSDHRHVHRKLPDRRIEPADLAADPDSHESAHAGRAVRVGDRYGHVSAVRPDGLVDDDLYRSCQPGVLHQLVRPVVDRRSR